MKISCLPPEPPLVARIPVIEANVQPVKTFTNPLLPCGADPWCIYREGFYYYTHTTGNNITLWKTTSLTALRTAEKKVVFVPPAAGPYAKELWAPELHFLQGKWYIYFAADCGKNSCHRLWVLENNSPDPLQGEWIFKGKLHTPADKWSIDGTVFEHHGQLYFLWSGWQGNVNGCQHIYMAKMKNPFTIDGPRVKISSPEFEWEMIGDLDCPDNPPHVSVNEGPVILARNNKLFLIYSASGCWTDFYALGMLTAPADCDPMDAAAWVKSPRPVFKQCRKNKVYAPGHNSFFKSPDGNEDWILYHANARPGMGCGKRRSPRAQQFSWKKDGTPYFGVPVKNGVRLNIPSL